MKQVTKFVSDDEEEFNTEEECFLHELIEVIKPDVIYESRAKDIAETLILQYEMKRRVVTEPIEISYDAFPVISTAPELPAIDPAFEETEPETL